MKNIMLNGAEHSVNKLLDGFTIKVTPASTSVGLFAVNPDKGELFVKFRNGAQYLYNPVDIDTLHAALKAESIGKFMHSIKGRFESTKINEDLFTLIPKIG